MNSIRQYHTATSLSDGRVLVAGGYSGAAVASAELYYPITGLFTTTGAMRSSRAEHAAALLSGNRVLIAGGLNSGGVRVNTADVYDVATGLFSTFVFNPRAFTPPLDPEGDNVYHFTTITIPAGITVRVPGDRASGSVFWLASGAVSIDGTLDLSGGPGHPATSSPSARVPSVPGPGGFGGGIGGNSTSPAQAGNGPAGGQVGPLRAGGFSGNTFLVPLVGGSGGAGITVANTTSWGSGGGAGGGAILIASSVGISVNGAIRADGGVAVDPGCGAGGGGGGGAIRLAAPVISGSGAFSVAGGFAQCGASGSAGRVRVETFDYRFTGSGVVTQGAPAALFVPTTVPAFVRVTSIAGKPVSSTPSGSFTLPDVQINEGVATLVTIEAHQVPQGTAVELHLFSDNGADQVVISPGLTGTLESSATTVSVTFPPGFTRGYPRAVWR